MSSRKIRLVSDQVDDREVRIIIRELDGILKGGIDGDVVEFGCYVGTTSLFIRQVLINNKSEKTFHVYDSFKGLPEKQAQDQSSAGDQFKKGELIASKATLIKNFKQYGLQVPVIHAGWFEELTDKDIPKQISFAFLDGDYYRSIATSLRLITPHLTPGARIIVDDYQSEALPGASRATDEWLSAQSHATLRVEHSLAIIILNRPPGM